MAKGRISGVLERSRALHSSCVPGHFAEDKEQQRHSPDKFMGR